MIEFQETNDIDDLKCRCCMENEVSEENPLLIMCKCKGSMGIIHFECQKTFLATKMKVLKVPEHPEVTSLFWN